MSNLTLDLNAEGVFPFHNIEDGQYLYGWQATPRANYQATNELSLHVSPTFQMGREDALSDAKVRLFRLNPDRRLLLVHHAGASDIRFDVPEIYLKIQPSPAWQIRLGRYYWDNTIQRIMRDWNNYEGFNDGNLADPQIAVGAFGGDVRVRKPWTEDFPIDLKASLSGGVGGRKEGLGLVQGLATFSLFDKYEMPGWVTSIGASLGYVYYPRESLPALLPGIDSNAAGGAVAPSILLQQGLGEMLSLIHI